MMCSNITMVGGNSCLNSADNYQLCSAQRVVGGTPLLSAAAKRGGQGNIILRGVPRGPQPARLRRSDAVPCAAALLLPLLPLLAAAAAPAAVHKGTAAPTPIQTHSPANAASSQPVVWRRSVHARLRSQRSGEWT
jgi:hypothetical protein